MASNTLSTSIGGWFRSKASSVIHQKSDDTFDATDLGGLPESERAAAASNLSLCLDGLLVPLEGMVALPEHGDGSADSSTPTEVSARANGAASPVGAPSTSSRAAGGVASTPDARPPSTHAQISRLSWRREIGDQVVNAAMDSVAAPEGLSLHGYTRTVCKGLIWCDELRLNELGRFDDMALLNYEQPLLGLLRTFLIEPLRQTAASPYMKARLALVEKRRAAMDNRAALVDLHAQISAHRNQVSPLQLPHAHARWLHMPSSRWKEIVAVTGRPKFPSMYSLAEQYECGADGSESADSDLRGLHQPCIRGPPGRARCAFGVGCHDQSFRGTGLPPRGQAGAAPLSQRRWLRWYRAQCRAGRGQRR